MKSFFRYTLALCSIAGLTIIPTAVFAQSTGQFTVTKYFSDNNPATVSISLSCGPGSTTVDNSPQDASQGSPAVFNLSNVVSTDDCTATESGAPTGYDSDEYPNCYEKQLTEDDPDYYIGSCTINNDAWCGDSQIAAYSEDCDDGNQPGGCCDQFCLFELETQICAASAGVCDEAEYCTGTSATCPADGDNLTSVCHKSNGLCDPAEYCSNSSNNCPVDVLDPVDTVCNPSQGVCDAAETCTGTSAVCPGDSTNDTTIECRPSVGVCDVADFCQKYDPDCPADVLEPKHTVCRADAGGDGCDVAEVCDGSTADCPTDLFADETTLCGNVPDFACDAQEVCTGTANECGPPPAELAACGVIGKGDGCELNVCDGEGPSDFKLLFTPDLPNWVAYKLNASNPGQFFYSLVSEPDVGNDNNLLLQVPFPFVTQGNMTLHVFDADDAWTEDICLVIDEGAGSTPYPVEITMDTYWDATDCIDPTIGGVPSPDLAAGAYCIHDGDVVCPSEYDPDDGGTIAPSLALQECWAYVPVQLENEGQFAARLHLDYGLKGKWLDEYCPSDATVDRYAPGAKGLWGDFEARGIDVAYSSTSNAWLNTCNIPTCQPYTFAQGVEAELESNCYSAHEVEGCDNAACEADVCVVDSYCCSESGDWDSLCAGEAIALCDADLVTQVEVDSTCHTESTEPGCNDEVCEAAVCAGDATCCNDSWDSNCVDDALGCPATVFLDVVVDPAESEVESVNYWKKPLGIFGRAYCDNGDDDPTPPLLGDGFAGLEARLYKSSSGTLLAKSPTDAEGFYFLNYKHKGKAVYYKVELWELDGTPSKLAETSGTGNPGNVPLQANGFAEQNFFDTGDAICSPADSDGWEAGEYSITKGKFKTIVTP